MKNEIVLAKSDLENAGITANLNQNDLVEVIAHEIFEKYMAKIHAAIKHGDQLYEESKQLMNPEIYRMRKALSAVFKGANVRVLTEEDAEDQDYDFRELSASYGKVSEHWPYISINVIKLTEKDKGTLVEGTHYNVNIPNLKSRNAKVKLTMSSGRVSEEKEIKVNGGISGTIETHTTKTFLQTVTVPLTRFREYQKKVIEYNKQVQQLKEYLPKNGLLSVERFTREARVKMNKKIISTQSAEFRKKMSEMFGIEL